MLDQINFDPWKLVHNSWKEQGVFPGSYSGVFKLDKVSMELGGTATRGTVYWHFHTIS